MASRRDKTKNRKLLRHERSLQPWPTGSARCRRLEPDRLDWQPLETDNWLVTQSLIDSSPLTLDILRANVRELGVRLGAIESPGRPKQLPGLFRSIEITGRITFEPGFWERITVAFRVNPFAPMVEKEPKKIPVSRQGWLQEYADQHPVEFRRAVAHAYGSHDRELVGVNGRRTLVYVCDDDTRCPGCGGVHLLDTEGAASIIQREIAGKPITISQELSTEKKIERLILQEDEGRLYIPKPDWWYPGNRLETEAMAQARARRENGGG